MEEHIKIGKVSQSEAQKAEEEYKKFKKEYFKRFKVKNQLREDYAYINSQYINYSKAFTILERFDIDQKLSEERYNDVKNYPIGNNGCIYSKVDQLKYKPETINLYNYLVKNIMETDSNGKPTGELKVKININDKTSVPPYSDFIQKAQMLKHEMITMDKVVKEAQQYTTKNIEAVNESWINTYKNDKYYNCYMNAKHRKQTRFTAVNKVKAKTIDKVTQKAIKLKINKWYNWDYTTISKKHRKERSWNADTKDKNKEKENDDDRDGGR